MKAVLGLNKWANANTNIGVDAVRVLLGVFLVYKGVFLLSNPEETLKVLGSVPGLGGANLLMIHYVAATLHVCAGVFVALGLLTRVVLLIMLPMVTTALFVNLSGSMIENNLLQACLTFIACACFLFYGSGKHSLDYLLRLHI